MAKEQIWVQIQLWTYGEQNKPNTRAGLWTRSIGDRNILSGNIEFTDELIEQIKWRKISISVEKIKEEYLRDNWPTFNLSMSYRDSDAEAEAAVGGDIDF